MLFAPAARREALFALYAFHYEIARVRETVTQPMLGQIRLQWWRENIAAAFGDGPVRHHPVMEPLAAAIREFGLIRDHFDRLIDARETDLADEPPASLSALENYAEESSSRLIHLALEVLGARGPAATDAGLHVGVAYALAGLLRAMPYRNRAGRDLTPVEIAAAASRHLGLARAGRSGVTRAALPALLPAIVAERYLTRLKQANFDPFDKALILSDPLQSWRFAAAALFNRF